MGGKDHERIIRDLMKTFDVSRYVAARLVVTETAFVANHSELRKATSTAAWRNTSSSRSSTRRPAMSAERDRARFSRYRRPPAGVNLPADASLVPFDHHPGLRPRLACYSKPVDAGHKTGSTCLIPATWNYDQWERWQSAGCPPVAKFNERIRRGLSPLDLEKDDGPGFTVDISPRTTEPDMTYKIPPRYAG